NQARAERELSRANAIVDFTDTLLEGIGPSVAVGRDTALLHDILDRAIENVGDKFKDQPGTELAVRSTIGQALYNLGDPKSARDQLLPIYNATADGSEKESIERLRAGVQLAQMYHNEFDFENMIKILDEVMPGFERAGLMHTDSAREGQLMQVWAMRATSRKNEAIELLEKLLEQLKHDDRFKSPIAFSARLELADIYVGIGRHDQACEDLKQILQDQREVFSELHPQIAETLSYLGESYQQQKKFDEAEKWYREGLELGRKIFPPGHSSLLATMTNYASILLEQNKLDEADPLLTEAYETGRKQMSLIASPMPGISQFTINLRLRQNRGPEAATIAMDLHSAFAEKYGARDRRTLSIYILLCKALPAAGRADEGIKMFDALGELSQYDLPLESQQSMYASSAHLYLAKDDIQGALRQHAKARGLVQFDELKRERITSSLRDLERKLAEKNITTQPTTAPTKPD
ncbi:MAG TPA: tetratricopeptide repeat protein, partial [Tepidisphaeraceae bacterium]|nr:tetratricopeptide repeat protein [Tepidisphaeraceae bacterium]